MDRMDRTEGIILLTTRSLMSHQEELTTLSHLHINQLTPGSLGTRHHLNTLYSDSVAAVTDL